MQLEIPSAGGVLGFCLGALGVLFGGAVRGAVAGLGARWFWGSW